MKFGISIMAPDPISTAYLINPFLHAEGLYVYPSMQRLGKTVTAATNSHNNRRTVGRVVFYTVCRLTERLVNELEKTLK
jgi:hypothetical protein